MTDVAIQNCSGVGERCKDCRAFSPDLKAKATTTFTKPGYCTDSMGPDGIIEGDGTPQANNPLFSSVGINSCFKTK